MIRRLFCRHKWKTHAKKEYKWEAQTMVKGTEHWMYPEFEKSQMSETEEVLICVDCGAIKNISY